MDLITIKELYKNREQYFDKEVTVGGWVRSNRDSKTFGFIVVNDGSYFETLQVVYHDTMDNFAEITKLNVGAYTEVAMVVNWGNQMYYSDPIARAFVVMAEQLDVTFIDKTGAENAERKFEFDNTEKKTFPNTKEMIKALENDDYFAFVNALNAICEKLVKLMAKDGEGATKLVECQVSGAKSKEIAKICAKSVICSSLVKAAMFGADANWGRVLCAIGYSGAKVDVSKVGVAFKSSKGEIEVCKNGAGADFSEDKAKEILLENEIEIAVCLGDGDVSVSAWGCDLTYDYVKINGDYRS